MLKSLRLIAQLVQDDEELVFDSGLYKRFRDFLQSIFANKCAYCETKLVALQKPVIEHYRPKGKITDENDAVVSDASGKPLPGYHWLAYAWGNLLPSCWVCNSTHKKNRFPVVGKHATDPHGLAAERPLLYNPLNPTSEPAEHIRIDLQTGVFEGLDDIGRTTIRVLDLNRVDLVDERREAIKSTSDLISQWLPALAFRRAELVDLEERIQAIKAGTAPYAFARRALYESAMGPIRAASAA